MLGNFKFLGVLRPAYFDKVGQGPTVVTVGASGLLGHLFSLLSYLIFFSLSLEDGSI